MKNYRTRLERCDLLRAVAAALIALGFALPGTAIGSDDDGASIQSDVPVDEFVKALEPLDGSLDFSGIHPWDNSGYSDTSETGDPGHVLQVGARPGRRADHSEIPELRKASGQPPLPRAVGILGNYPNPFNAQTRLAFSLSRSGDVDLRLFNLLGQPIRSERMHALPAGAHEWTWDGRGDRGQMVPSGVYFLQIVMDRDAAVHKMVLLK